MFLNNRWVFSPGFESIHKSVSRIVQIENEHKYQKSLAETLSEFHLGMDVKDKKDRILALKNILPTEDDYKKLFPDFGTDLWKLAEPSYKKLVNDIDNLTKIIKEQKWTNIEYTNLRKVKTFKNITNLISKGIPVFKVTKSDSKRNFGPNFFLYVNHRWIVIHGLNKIPSTIEKLKQKELDGKKKD